MGRVSNWCQCITCKLFTDDVIFAVADPIWPGNHITKPVVEGYCDVCLIMHGRSERYKEKRLVHYIPQEVKEFLRVETCCWSCSNVINCHVKGDFGLCWGKASVEAIQLALCKMLRSWLATEANKDIYHQQIVTSEIRKGRQPPSWATPEMINRAAVSLANRGIVPRPLQIMA